MTKVLEKMKKHKAPDLSGGATEMLQATGKLEFTACHNVDSRLSLLSATYCLH